MQGINSNNRASVYPPMCSAPLQRPKAVAVQRALDSYGIDLDWRQLARLHDDDTRPVVFASEASKGAYMSSRAQGDVYGDFYYYSGRGLLKYQAQYCVKMQFDERSIQALKRAYHNVVGVTDFLEALLNKAPGSSFDFYTRHPERYALFNPANKISNAFLIYPNLPYIEDVSSQCPSVDLKDKREGVILGAWAIHPNQQLGFLNAFEGFGRKQFWGEAAATDKGEYSNDRCLSDIERGSGVKYLSSILDLDKTDLAQLRKLEADVLEHLASVYDVSRENDKVKMYFHFPVANKTATLHLHVWVNRGDHPLNEARSFELGSIIEGLEAGKTIDDMILARESGTYYSPLSDSIRDIKGIPNNGTVDNPFKLEFVH